MDCFVLYVQDSSVMTDTVLYSINACSPSNFYYSLLIIERP